MGNINQENGKFVEERWAQLYEIEKESADHIFRYLLLVNSGGAIATLSFLGASSVAFGMPLVKWALLVFLVGILLVGATYIFQFHHRSSLFNEFRNDVVSHSQNKITFSELTSRDESRAQESLWHYLLPYAAFFCFIVGCGLGIAALLGCSV